METVYNRHGTSTSVRSVDMRRFLRKSLFGPGHCDFGRSDPATNHRSAPKARDIADKVGDYRTYFRMVNTMKTVESTSDKNE